MWELANRANLWRSPPGVVLGAAMKHSYLLAFALGAVFLSSCTERVGGFPVISTHNVDLARIESSKKSANCGIEGESSVAWFLFIPLGRQPQVGDAVDLAIRNGGGDCMVNATVEQTWYWFIIGGYSAYVARGDVINTSGMTKTVAPKPTTVRSFDGPINGHP